MDQTISTTGAVTISSGDRLTIEMAAEFAATLREALRGSETVTIKFAPAVVVDTTTLQILCSACKTAATEGKRLSIQGAFPETLSQLISMAGGATRYSVCRHNNDTPCLWFGGTL